MQPYNPIMDSDSYKLSHFLAYPDDVTHVFSYLESRGGRYADTVFFGIQAYVKKLAETTVTLDMVDEAAEFAAAHGEPFNLDGWKRIVEVHGGKLPVRIRAVPEGMRIPVKNVLATVENTDPELPWLTSYVETALLRIWYAITVATRVANMRRDISLCFDQTSDNGINPFALLDFSSRGCAALEANEIGGAAYLLSFMGSDSIPAVRYANRYYDSVMSGFSVPATEHSIMCSWGKDRELESFEAMIDRFGGDGKIISVVSDTWDIYAAAEKWGTLADKIKSTGTTLVFRPDSGDACEVLPRVLATLEEAFGSVENSKGFRVLNNVKVLWGDGIDEYSCTEPFDIAASVGISADSIMVGSGGGLMQVDINRDTCKFAFKASAVKRGVNGWEGIAKDPITDPGKKSKMGRLKLIGLDGVFSTQPFTDHRQDVLRTIYEDGVLSNMDSLETIRERVNSHS